MVANGTTLDPGNPNANNGSNMATHEPAPPSTGTASSAATTVSNNSTYATDPEQQITALDLAYDELQRTFHEAAALREQPSPRPRLIKSHATALQEDIDLLASLETADPDKRTKATQLILQSRRLRRQLERDLININVPDDDCREQHIVQVMPLEPSRQPNMQLAPLKTPTFSGDVAQFRMFRGFYEENVLNNAQLTDTAKWLRLSESLSGPPAELISEIPQTNHTLLIAWKLLVDTYGGDDRPIVQLYERLQRLPPSTMATSALRMTHSKLEGILLSLENFGHNITDNGYIRWVYMSKFPVEIAYQVQKTKDVNFTELRTAINSLLLARECVDQHSGIIETPPPYFPVAQRMPQPTNAEKKRQPSSPSKNPSARPLRCIFCNGEHWNDVCTVYPSLESRRDRLTGKCFICLRKQHVGTPCLTQRRCFHCDSFEHNRALCPKKFQEPLNRAVTQAAIIRDTNHAHSTGYFLTFLTQAVSNHVTDPLTIRVVVDTAGGTTVLRKELAKALRIPKTNITTAFTGLGGTKLASSCGLAEPFQLLPQRGPPLTLHADMIDWIIPDVPAADVQQFRHDHPQFNEISIPPTGEGLPIDLLIGSDTLVDLLTPDKIIEVNATTLLMPTKFGSLIMGRTGRPVQKVCHSLLFNILKNPLATMCNLDLVGLSGLHDTQIEHEQYAIQNFYDTVRFVEGRYSISWPWKCNPPQLDSNFGLSLGRLKSLHRRLQNSTQLLLDYHSIIQQQLNDNIIEKVDFQIPTKNLTHYLPHHPVLQPGKSTAIRPVYDGSSKTTANRKSLNDNIYKGKNWLNDLVRTLLRFHRFKYVATADVSKAFHQISINEDNRDAARFLWLKDPLQPPEISNIQAYRFTRVAFGIIASPFILSATIQYHAAQQPQNDFAKILLQDFYADNLVTALEDQVDPLKFYEYAKNFFQSMKMNLTKWTSNNSNLLTHIPDFDKLLDLTQFVLGLQWNRATDMLSIKQPKLQHDKIPTRRTVAREMAAYFDPLGWATPVLLLAKSFFRKVWEQTEKWDEPLSPQIHGEWREISTKIRQVIEITLPRYLGLSDGQQTVQLHAFVDASAVAYAVVAYIKIQSANNLQISLISSKSRLTPTKPATIPKLELLAIVLGARYLTFLIETLELPKTTTTYIWSDSQCALSWVKNNKILPTVLEKFVTEIRAYKINNFRYVPSDQNFADVATRGADLQSLQTMGWWCGPEWLRDESQWPTQEISVPENNPSLIFQTKLMFKQNCVSENEIEGIATLKIRNFSSLTTLLTRTAYIFKATIQLCKTDFLNTQADIDIPCAEKHWIRWDQSRVYTLSSEPTPGKTFLLRNITVFRDEHKIIRCATRITNSIMELDVKSPILLVKDSTLTQLIILHTHLLHKHAGTNHTLANIRQKYWLPHGYRQVYKVIVNKCYYCRRQLANTYPNPPPAPLPEFRVVRSQKPFQVVGVDIFGPFSVRHIESIGYIKQKRWVIIFTCATVRAIHLEILIQLTTEEISHAFRKFVARRGVPKKFISDNAPQFHALDGYFSSLWHTVAKSPTLSNYFAQNQIMWHFITETAPWMGAIYERLIQSVKVAFERTYANKTLQSRQFETAIIEIEAMLNARPLTYINRDPETPILTPNDFLMATYVSIPILQHPQPSDDTIKKLWKSSQAYLDEFWKNWANQYLMLLCERNDQLPTKVKNAKYQPQKGDVVVMQDISKKRSAWQMAVVERLIAGTDNEIRSVQIKIPNGSRLIRPVISLAPLGIQADLPDIHDHQLNKRRDAVILWPREDASQNDSNSNEQRHNTVEERGVERDSDEDEA